MRGQNKSTHNLSGSVWITVFLVILFAESCSSPQYPIRILEVSVHPDPVIGETVKFSVEVVSTENEADAHILIELPPGVKLMDGSLEWAGSLVADQQQTHEISVCVLYEGDWKISIEAYSLFENGSSYQDQDTIHFITEGDTVRVVPGGAYRITQPPGGNVPPTDVPITPPAGICP